MKTTSTTQTPISQTSTPVRPRVLPVPSRTNYPLREEVERLADRLLRRGFPLHVERRGIVLSPGNWDQDLRYLCYLLRPLMSETPISNPIHIWHGDQFLTNVDGDRCRRSGQWERRILDFTGRCNETCLGYTWEDRMDPWKRFLRMHYGAKTFVPELEAGVALLVKVLPWVSIYTKMSCHGHDSGRLREKDARIWFSTSNDSRWCEMILNRLGSDLAIHSHLEFRHGDEPGYSVSPQLVISLDRNRREPARNQQIAYAEIQQMARRFFDPELCRNIRKAKAGTSDLEDLKRRLDAVTFPCRHSANGGVTREPEEVHSSPPSPLLPEIPEVGSRMRSLGEWTLADTLLRRGFPVRFEDRGLVLCPGAMEEDVKLLRRTLMRLRPVRMHASQDFPKIDVWYGEQRLVGLPVDRAYLTLLRETILVQDSRRRAGLTGPPCRGGRSHRDFAGFTRCRFGSRFPLRRLEDGIALLVKVLPWVGVMTSMSCEGHFHEDKENTSPRLWFYSHYHSLWCEMLFNRLFGDLPIRQSWHFDHGETDGNWCSATWEASIEPPNTHEEQQFLFDQIQIMARRLFDPELCARIREAKSGCRGPENLVPRLEAVFHRDPETELLRLISATRDSA